MLWLYIGRNVAPQKLEDIFGLPTPPSGIYEKPKTLTLNIGGSFEANKVAAIMQNLLQNNWCKQGERHIQPVCPFFHVILEFFVTNLSML